MVTSIEQLEATLNQFNIDSDEKQKIMEDAQVFFDLQKHMLETTTMEADGLEGIIALNVMNHMQENKDKITSEEMAIEHSLIAVSEFARKHNFDRPDEIIEKGLLLVNKIKELNKGLKK